jgi:beta-xylosidase
MGQLDDDNRGAKTRIDTYTKLYKGFAGGISRVSEKLRMGGPGLSMYVHFLDGFLKNACEQKIPLKFVTVHAYGTEPGKINSGKQLLNSNDPVVKFAELETTVKKYFDEADIIVDEWGASSGGFIDREKCPGIMFREDSIMPVFMAKMVKAYIDSDRRIDKLMICLSGQHEMKVDFSGFRSLFTLNHIKKPIYNGYVLFDKVYENLLESSWNNENMQVIATKGDGVSVMIAYASENFNQNLPSLNEKVEFKGIEGKRKVTVWIIDETHTNPYKLALRNGWGDGEYTREQVAVLKEEGIMKPADVYEKDFSEDNTVEINFSNNALVLVEVE